MAKREARRVKPDDSSRVGVSETVLEMGAEIYDPAMWAAIQLAKPVADPPKTIGELHTRIADVMRKAIEMEMRRAKR